MNARQRKIENRGLTTSLTVHFVLLLAVWICGLTPAFTWREPAEPITLTSVFASTLEFPELEIGAGSFGSKEEEETLPLQEDELKESQNDSDQIADDPEIDELLESLTGVEPTGTGEGDGADTGGGGQAGGKKSQDGVGHGWVPGPLTGSPLGGIWRVTRSDGYLKGGLFGGPPKQGVFWFRPQGDVIYWSGARLPLSNKVTVRKWSSIRVNESTEPKRFYAPEFSIQLGASLLQSGLGGHAIYQVTGNKQDRLDICFCLHGEAFVPQEGMPKSVSEIREAKLQAARQKQQREQNSKNAQVQEFTRQVNQELRQPAQQQGPQQQAAVRNKPHDVIMRAIREEIKEKQRRAAERQPTPQPDKGRALEWHTIDDILRQQQGTSKGGNVRGPSQDVDLAREYGGVTNRQAEQAREADQRRREVEKER